MASDNPLARLITRRVHALGEHLPAALEGDVRGTHQARVATRRLRELLPVAGPLMKTRARRRLRRRLRRLTRALGPVREADVSLATADRIAGAHAEPRAAVAALTRVLGAGREAGLAAMSRRFDPGRVERLLARLTGLAAGGTASDDAVWRDLLADRIRRRARGLNAAVADAGALFVSDRLHRLRIAVKQLRYALEVAGDARVAPTAALVRTLKNAQEVLGALHDDDVLLGAVRQLTLDGAAPAELVTAVAWFDRELTVEMRRLHARYLRRQTHLIRVADRALDVVAPKVETRAGWGAIRPGRSGDA